MLQYTPDLFVERAKAEAPVSAPATCQKCNGTRKFVSYTGRVVGECYACKPKAEAVDVANVDRLMACFDSAAKTGLKRPVMRFEGFQASLAPKTGANPGAVYLKSDGLYLGKIVGGRFFASGDCNQVARASVESAMADPLAAAIAYGRRTGACSCCGRTLSDPQSVARGIGPICARNFGL